MFYMTNEVEEKTKQGLNLKYVTDLVGDDYKRWDTFDDVIISSPTGTGKNRFIVDKLIPHAEKSKKKILILTNRIALRDQQKMEIAKAVGEDLSEYMPNALRDNWQKTKVMLAAYDYIVYCSRRVDRNYG